jgi:hypothetical protein
MRQRPMTFLRVAARLTCASAVILAASCSLTEEDDDDGNDSNVNLGGAAGQGVSFGGRSGGASGTTASAGSGNTAGTTGSACQSLMAGDCGGSSVEANFKTVNILLVIDKSGSMDDTPEGFDDKKWDSLKQALDGALSATAADINFGLLMYPYSDIPIPLDNCGARCCEVPPSLSAINVSIGPGTDTVPDILGQLNGTSPGGGTPTAAALSSAFDYFTVGGGSELEGERYVLLATDGGPNCNPDLTCEADRCTTNLDGQCSNSSANCCMGANLGDRCLDDESVKTKVAELYAAGIPTFVVGIPGTEQYSTYLSAIAEVSGAVNPNGPEAYYRVDAVGGVEGLRATFESITTQLVRSCDIDLAMQPLDSEKVNVYIDCELVPKGQDDNLSWEVDTTTPTGTIHLQGQVCARVQTEGAERVDVTFGCPSVR